MHNVIFSSCSSVNNSSISQLIKTSKLDDKLVQLIHEVDNYNLFFFFIEIILNFEIIICDFAFSVPQSLWIPQSCRELHLWSCQNGI